tara:strand:+ start:1842 stop:2726 length:885 start_codon:yes stop_codon:yes gene_type:complete
MYPKSLLDPQREGQITLRQIKFWIHYNRAKLIQENVSKGILSNNNLYQRANVMRRPITYENHESFVNNPIGNFTKDYLDFYGRKISKTQNRGDWRNLGYVPLNIPEIISIPNDAGITVSMSRRVLDVTNMHQSPQPPKMIALYRKSIADKNFGDFNKFTKNDKPYYTIEKQMSLHNPQLPNTVKNAYSFNGNTLLMINGLQISPNNYGDLEVPAGELIDFQYRFFINFILQDPTQIEEDLGGLWSHEGGGEGQLQKFDDDTTPYPIPAEHVKDLIERVLQTEGSVSLKTLQSEL